MHVRGREGDTHYFRHSFALQIACNASFSFSHLAHLFPQVPAGATIWVGDSASTVHAVGSDKHVYNKRRPLPEERRVYLGNGHSLNVLCIGYLDLILHCREDVPVTLEGVAVVKGLAFDLMSINCIQERYDVLMNRTGAWLLNDRVNFTKAETGNYIAATRVPRGSAGPPAMVAAMLRPGPRQSINCDDLHYPLGHTNDANARETAKQRGLKVTGIGGTVTVAGSRRRSDELFPG